MLASMTATLSGVLDGTSEILAANVSNTSITSSYANGVLKLSGVASPADYQTVLKTVTYKDTAASPTAGVRTIAFVVNDGIVNSLPATATVSVIVPPAGYTITTGSTLINASEAANTSFTFAGAVVGATYSYTVTSSGGSGSVTGMGTITSATQQITGINVSTLPNGTLTYSVTLSSTAGAVGSPATATATLDQTAPAGYTITAADTVLSATDAASTGFTFAGAEVGATYNYTITSDGGSGSVTGSGTITSATQQITSINVSTLPDGTLTYSVTLTDPAGNVGTAVTATATLDKAIPTGYTITAGNGSSARRRPPARVSLSPAPRSAPLTAIPSPAAVDRAASPAREQSLRRRSKSPALTSRRCPMERSPIASRLQTPQATPALWRPPPQLWTKPLLPATPLPPTTPSSVRRTPPAPVSRSPVRKSVQPTITQLPVTAAPAASPVAERLPRRPNISPASTSPPCPMERLPIA